MSYPTSEPGVNTSSATGMDWADTPLGAMASWPTRLRALVGAFSGGDIPSCLFWGAQAVMIPNAAWVDMAALDRGAFAGRPAGAVSPELDRACRAARAAAEAGAAPDLGDALLPLLWRGLVARPSACPSCTAILDDAGRAEGLLVQVGLAPAAGPTQPGPADPRSNDAFMLRLGDALRRLDDADDIQTCGARMLGEFLDADRASFAAVDLAAGRASERCEYRRDAAAPPHEAEHDLGAFGPAIQCLLAGLPLVIDDMDAARADGAAEAPDGVAAEVLRHARAPFRAQLTAPIARADDLVAVITLRHDRPHRWTAAEIAVAEQAGTRIWEAIERARAEADLRLSEQRFRALVTATSHVYYRMSPDWRELRRLDSEGFLEDTANPCRDWLDAYVDPRDQARVMAAVDEALTTRRPFECEHRVRCADGGAAWVWSRAAPVRDASGEIVEWFGAASDITAPKRAEDALRVSEARFCALVTATSHIIYRLSADWRELIHLQWRDFGAFQSEPDVDWLERYILPADQPQVREAIRQAIETRSLFALEHRVRRPDGSVGRVLSRAVPVLDEQGEIVEWFGAATDVTEQRDAEEAAREAVAQRLEATRAADARKARLMAVLAHDLRTPLVALLGSLDLLRDGLDPMTQKQLVERIQGEGQGMLRLIDDVLDLARLGAGEARLRPVPVVPAALAEAVAALIRPMAADNGTKVVVDAADMPPIMADDAALRRILLNFAANAVKATKGGHIRLTVEAGPPGPDGRAVSFAVSDTGCGIAAADMPLLFRDFGMLDREDARMQGTGLGLAICRRLATAMGGEIAVESTPGVGSCFRLRLRAPEAEVQASVAASPGASPGADDPTAALDGLRVLVAEDQETIRQFTCMKLARRGAQLVEAADGVEAVERAAAERFDLILMDLGLPRLDGAAAAARIREGGGPSARAPIVGLTAHDTPPGAAMPSDGTMDACLPKPLDLPRLVALLHGAEQSPGAGRTQDGVVDPTTPNGLAPVLDANGDAAR